MPNAAKTNATESDAINLARSVSANRALFGNSSHNHPVKSRAKSVFAKGPKEAVEKNRPANRGGLFSKRSHFHPTGPSVGPGPQPGQTPPKLARKVS